MSENAEAVYQNALKYFSDFRWNYLLPHSWPVPVAHAAFYFLLFQSRLFPCNSLNTHVINQLYIHKIKDFTDPTESVLIEKILEGFKWLKSMKDIHAPITKELLTVFASYMLQWIWKLIIQVTIHIRVFWFLLCRKLVYTNHRRQDMPYSWWHNIFWE